MLYVFHVDTGRMLTFDMNIAVQSVQYLKETIQRHHGIPAKDQVLLISGGETLQNSARVGRYSAGTDTNPIFMFCKTVTDARNLPPPWQSVDSDSDLDQQVQRNLEQPATYNTLVSRVTLAQQIYEIAKSEFKECERLVMEQHLQQQGWCAVVANLEDITNDFQERCDVFFRGFGEHLEKRDEYGTYLGTFSEDLTRLSQIPIMPGLLQNAEEKRFSAFDDVYTDKEFNNSDNSAQEDAPVEGEKKSSGALSLMQWISASENQKSLRRMAENCSKELGMFDEKTITALQGEIDKAVEAATREDMKEIKGLEDRLQGLEKLMRDARKIVQDQSEMATAFQQNQLRAANLRDPSVLPDLCEMHKNQLKAMMQYHKQIRDIRRRCAKAKDELGTNLFQRLKFIIQVENLMWEIDSRLLFYHNCLRRLQKHLNIIEQIHQAPSVYVSAVNEVVRRREFSSAFLLWASELACHLMRIYNDEMLRRQEFHAIFDGHFLSTLFPGINDVPPPYATEAPATFDSSLPILTRNDVVELSNQLPEYATKSSLFQDVEAVIKFFTQSRSYNKSIVSTTSQEKAEAALVEPQTLKPPDLHAHLKDYEKGFESETDTEEFEKVSQSPVDRRSTVNVQTASQTNPAVILPTTIKPEMTSVSTSVHPVETNSVETLTDDTYAIMETELARLKALLTDMQQRSLSSIALLRRELDAAKLEILSTREAYNEDMLQLQNAWKQLDQEAKNRERELVQRLTVDHELEMNDIRKSLNVKEDELQTIRNEKEAIEAVHMDVVTQHESEKGLLRDQIEKLSEELSEKRRELEAAETAKEQQMAEMREKMLREHKNEVETMKSRIRMMTSVDRSPSDTSLEKIERPDMIDMVNHEMIVAQLREDFMKERDAAVAEALEQERIRLESLKTLQPVAGSPRSPTSMTSENLLRRMIEERDKQLDTLREREAILVKENMKYRDTIQSLADSEITVSNQSLLKDKLEQLQRDKEALEAELQREKQKRSKSSSSGGKQLCVNLKGCQKGDLVLVTWNSTHEQYTVVQESSTLVFLNENSYVELGLTLPSPPTTLPTTLHTFGFVTDKEYCHARKDENRYKVQKGMKFYRVKVKARHPIVNRISDSMNVSTSSVGTRSTSTETLSDKRASLIDSCAQTDLEPLFETESPAGSNDMVDSGVSEQQKSSLYRSERTASEDIVTQLDEASAVDTSEEADAAIEGNDVVIQGSIHVMSSSRMSASNIKPMQYEIQTSTTSTDNSSKVDVDDLDSLSDEYRSLESKPEGEDSDL